MPIHSRSKSIRNFAKDAISEMDMDDSSMESGDSFSSASHLANLRSMSRGKLLKSSSERHTKLVSKEIRNLNPNIAMKHGVSHDSIELLSTSCAHPSAQRRQTLAAIPKRLLHIDEEGDGANMNTSYHISSLLPGAGNVIHSPQIVGGLQYKTNSSCRKPYKPRNSIDNADVSGYKSSRKLILETMQEHVREDQAARIKVFVRLRPMSSKERDAGARCCVRESNRREIYLTEMASESDYLRLKRLKGRYFAFDGAFPGDSSQEEIYRCSTAQLVEGVLEGRNSSVFCYGATGAGKTFTMLGTVQDPGVMVLAIKDLFSKLNQRSREQNHSVCLSYLEVYNETVRDLLSPGRALVIREDVKQGIVVAGLTQYKVFSEDEVMALLQQGNQNRTTEPTRLNETSSRSHAILQVIVEYSTYVESCLMTRIGKLSLIDLAGSERAIATDQRTLRSLEGANINRSLLALSSCISALVEGKKHIPFRNSKLTQLLKDSLGGACQTAMIANIGPSNLSFGETQNTLYWADRAKEIRTKACVANEELRVPGSGSEQLQLLLQLQKENQQLRMEVAQLQQKVLTLENKAMASTPATVYEDGSLHVAVSPPATPLEEPVQKENPGVSGTDAAITEKHFSHCTENKRIGVSLNGTHQVNQLQQKLLILENKAMASTAVAVHRDGSLRVAASASATLLEKPVQKENMGRTGTDAGIRESHFSHCTENKLNGVSLDGTHLVNSRVNSHPNSVATDIQPQVICESTLLRTPLTLSSIKRKIMMRSPLPPSQNLSLGFHSTSRGHFCRKRTFWDITNTNSPYSKSTCRNTRSNTRAETPSMLLQPGFLRGRPSFN